jgi:hypothetical protein
LFDGANAATIGLQACARDTPNNAIRKGPWLSPILNHDYFKKMTRRLGEQRIVF